MIVIELIAVIFTLISIYLTVNDNILCWPTGIIGVIFYAVIFYNLNLLADFSLQLIFLAQSIFAWVNWNKKTELKISYLENRALVTNLTGALYMIIFSIANNLNGNMPFVDSAIATFSIMAMFLLIKKKVESWIFWILNDILLVVMFFINNMYLSTGLYLIFLSLAISGLFKWIKEEKNEIQ